jgi:hypothetical protein|tara:strand:- start:2053 stop:2463 length:411 start_codon:yes stop_codon:yes gene_type:complete
MATEILISYGEKIVIDQSKQSTNEEFTIKWADKGNAFPNLGNDIHYVVYNTLPGGNEVQKKDPSTLMMTGNTALTGTSSVVGNSITVQNLLTWGETRKGQITTAQDAYEAAVADDVANGTNNADGKTWIDYDSNYS